MNKPLFSVRNLTKNYRGVIAVDDVSFDVQKGSITGLIGPNGSGKSTTIDCISGFQQVNCGTWAMSGTSLEGRSPQAHALAGLTRTFQTVRSYEDFTLVENIQVAAQEHQKIGMFAAFVGSASVRRAEAAMKTRAHELLDMVGLSAYADAPVAVLSYGQRKLLSIACSMASEPDLVILDEPVSGINPTMIHRVEQAVIDLNRRGTTLLIVEHNMDFIMRLCTKVIVLVAGKLLVEGEPSVIQRDSRVLEAYLGSDLEVEPA